jgi:hypothetical protein
METAFQFADWVFLMRQKKDRSAAGPQRADRDG